MNHFCASDISSAEFVFNKVKLQQWVQPLLGLSQSNTHNAMIIIARLTLQDWTSKNPFILGDLKAVNQNAPRE